MHDDQEVIQVKMCWVEEHPEGVIFYDVKGIKYLFNTSSGATTKLSTIPDVEMLSRTLRVTPSGGGRI